MYCFRNDILELMSVFDFQTSYMETAWAEILILQKRLQSTAWRHDPQTFALTLLYLGQIFGVCHKS